MSLKARYEDMPSDQILRHINEMAFTSSVFFRTTTAHYDPIFTPLFTAIFGTATIGATSITYASVATAIATTAVTVGIQMLLAPKPPKPEQGKFPVKQAIPYRIWGVGRTRLAGALMLWRSNPTGTQLIAIHAMAGHRVKSYNKFWLHDDQVQLASDGYVNTPNTSRYTSGAVQIQSRLGLATETAYQPAVALFGSTGLWTNNHRGDGQASMMVRSNAVRLKDQTKRYPYGPPQGSAEMDLAFCWDFRDPAQSATNPATWTWTQNSAVICAWHLCFNEFGFRLDYRKAILPVLDLWKEEADICDEDIPNAAGGSHKRYQCNGYDTTENGPKAGLNAILATCDGHLVARGDGARILTVGKFRESRVVTLTDADIVGHQIQYDVVFDEECNRLVPKFNDPNNNYTTMDVDFFEDTARQLTAGRVLSQEGNYQWCTDWRQCRMLGIRDWRRIQEKIRGSLNVRLSGINAVYARWVRLATATRMPSLNGALIENRSSILDLMKGGFSMDFIKHPANIDAWTPTTDEGGPPPIPPVGGDEAIPTPVINLVQPKPNGQSVYIRVVVVDPLNDTLTPVVRYRVADNGSGTPGAWVEQSFPDWVAGVPSVGYVELNTNVVPSEKLLDIEALFKTSKGDQGAWSARANVTSIVYPNPPGDVTAVSVTPSSTAGQAVFNWTSPNDDTYSGARVYWNTTNNFTGATQFSPPKYSGPGVAQSYRLTGLSAGTRYGFVVPINKSNIPGNAVPTGGFTVV